MSPAAVPAEQQEIPAPSLPPPPPNAPPRQPRPPSSCKWVLYFRANQDALLSHRSHPSPTTPFFLFYFYFHPLAPTLLRIQSCALAGYTTQPRLCIASPSSPTAPPVVTATARDIQHTNFTYWILFSCTPNLLLLASSQTRYMENKIELFLANRDSVIHQTKLVHGDETAQLFEMHILSSCLKKNGSVQRSTAILPRNELQFCRS